MRIGEQEENEGMCIIPEKKRNNAPISRTSVFSIILAFVFLFLLVALNVILLPEVSAVSPDSRTSTTYLLGKYGKNFQTLPLSGNLREDTLALALSQLGYHEGDSELDFDGENTSGNDNFTEFCYHFGKVTNNYGVYGYNYEWCAAFVSWCATMAGVPASMLKPDVSCARMVEWLRERNCYFTKNKHPPVPGDIIFFKDADATRVSTHVGYVLYSDGTYVYTIEGNNSGQVRKSSYLLTSSYVVGYGVIDYSGKESKVDYSSSTLDAGWYISNVAMNIRAGEAISSEVVGYVGEGVVFGVSLVRGTRAYINYNGVVGWVTVSRDYALQISTASPPDAVKYTVRFTTPDGSLISALYLCLGDSFDFPDPPEIEGYEFTGWSGDASPVRKSVEYCALYRELEQVTTIQTESENENESESESVTEAEQLLSETGDNGEESENGSVDSVIVVLISTVAAVVFLLLLTFGIISFRNGKEH